MRKGLVTFLLPVLLLTGCGTQLETALPAANPSSATETEAIPAEPLPVPVEEPVTEAPPVETVVVVETVIVRETVIETVLVPAETEPVPTEAPASETDRDTVIRLYKYTIEDKFVSLPDGGSIEYALYDMDYDGIPELLLKYGTCEADYQIAIYTVRDGYVTQIKDNLGGGHTSFAYDYKANQIVLAQGHMGGGDMDWYDLDDNGDLRWLINTGGFTFGGPDDPAYTDVMKKYNVAYLPISMTFMSTDGAVTYIYWDMNAPEVEGDQRSGLDYSLLENYEFS